MSETLGHIADWPERGLPVPRLEINWQGEGLKWVANYVMVYRFWGDDRLFGVPLGRTKVDGPGPDSPHRVDGPVHTPFRDGVHIARDSAQLRLPAYATYKDRSSFIEPRADHVRTLGADEVRRLSVSDGE